MDIRTLLRDATAGHRLTEPEAAVLMKVQDRQIFDILAAADTVREARAGPEITFVRNQNIHITNI
jgi:FO synthase subunit 2